MPIIVGGAIAGGAALTAAGISAYSNYKARKAQEKADKKKQADQLAYANDADKRLEQAGVDANGDLIAGSAQGQEQLRQSMGQGQDALNQGYAQGRQDLNQYYGQGMGYLAQGDQLAMSRLSAGQQAAQGTLERTAANSRLAALMDGGLASGFQTDPGYAFRQQQGEQSLQRQASAAGGRLGTRSLQSLMNFNSGLASQEYGNYANRAIGMAGTEDARQASLMGMLAGQQYGAGQQGAGYAQNWGNNSAQSAFGMGSNLSNLATGQGNSLAQLYMNGGNNLAQMMYNTGAQQGANRLTAAGGSASLANNMLGQFNAPQAVPSGWGEFGTSAFNTVGQLGANYMMYGGGSGGGGGYPTDIAPGSVVNGTYYQ